MALCVPGVVKSTGGLLRGRRSGTGFRSCLEAAGHPVGACGERLRIAAPGLAPCAEADPELVGVVHTGCELQCEESVAGNRLRTDPGPDVAGASVLQAIALAVRVDRDVPGPGAGLLLLLGPGREICRHHPDIPGQSLHQDLDRLGEATLRTRRLADRIGGVARFEGGPVERCVLVEPPPHRGREQGHRPREQVTGIQRRRP